MSNTSKDKYTLTKTDKADVNTSSESVKHRYLADGYTLTKGKSAGLQVEASKSDTNK